MNMKTTYSVIVGNLGNVHEGFNARNARKAFASYVSDSKANYGRAAGENVTLMREDEPVKEYYSPAQEMREDLDGGECATLSEDSHGPNSVYLCGKHIATIGEDCTEAQALAMLRAEMASQGFYPNCYRINERGNVSQISVHTGKAYKGKSWV